MKAFVNLYRQGHSHRLRKMNTLSLHAGDTYATRESALIDIDPAAPYLGTIEIEIPAGITVDEFTTNDPVGLAWSREKPGDYFGRAFVRLQDGSHPDSLGLLARSKAVMASLEADDEANRSLETTENEAFEPLLQTDRLQLTRRAALLKKCPEKPDHFSVSAAYKPAHGGYPGEPRS